MSTSVREEKPIEPWDYWWPEPDIAVARGKQRRYEDRHPGPGDLALLVEVSDIVRAGLDEEARRICRGRDLGLLDPRTWPSAGSRSTAIQASGRATRNGVDGE